MKRVMVNGCFDILHPGHILYLTAAKSYGDHLVVGLNVDSSSKDLYHSYAERRDVLRALKMVDSVVGFEGETAEYLLMGYEPEVYVTSVDYPNSPEVRWAKENGVEVIHLPRIPRYSTTNIRKYLGI